MVTEFWQPKRKPPDGWAEGADAILRRAATDHGGLASLIAKVDYESASYLTQYAVDATRSAVRQRDPGLLRRAAFGLVVANARTADPRDQMYAAALVWHALGLLCLDARAEFQAPADVVAAWLECQRFVEDWLDRPQELQTLECMGIRAEHGPRGYYYM